MNKSALVKWFGFPAMLVHGDTLVLDRWLWLRRRLPLTHDNQKLIDVGCGNGAFTIGAARRGYAAVGLTWDERDRAEARNRADLTRTAGASFAVADVRSLGELDELTGRFDVAVCCEVIEHILDDRKLMRDLAQTLKPGGRLLLTTPNLLYRAMSPGDNGPFEQAETGGHVRRGYSPEMLHELAQVAGLRLEEISYCSGFFSQLATRMMRRVGSRSVLAGWLLTLPLRPVAPVLDATVGRVLRWPLYSICMVAVKPRFRDEAGSATSAASPTRPGAR